MSTIRLRLRISEVKKRLPKSGVSSLFFFIHGDKYNKEDPKTRRKLSSVLSGIQTDEDITIKLEQIAAHLEKIEKFYN